MSVIETAQIGTEATVYLSKRYTYSTFWGRAETHFTT